MNEFHKQYLNLPNKDLIRIISKPGNYQPAAVAAATEILSERIVTDEDHELARLEEESEDKWLNMRSDFISSRMKKAGDTLKYLFTPSDKFDVKKWIIVICLVVGGYYIFDLVRKIEYFIFFASCYSCHFSALEIATLFDMVYIPVMLYLLLKKNIFGWGLLIASVVFGLLSTLSYLFTATGIIDQIPILVVQIAFRVAVLVFLLKKEVKDYFRKINREKFDDFLEEQSTESISE